MKNFTAGMRVLCRDAEWLITHLKSVNSIDDMAVYCIGADDFNRGHEAVFLTQLEEIQPVDPRLTKLVPDDSGGYAKAKLFLEATPHNGKRETFGRLISLLDPSAIPDPKLQAYEARDISPFFLMRFKEDIREEAGEHFASREVVPLAETSIHATPQEETVYGILADMRQKVLDKRLKANAIVQWGMYKSFLSSPEACGSTAEKRCKLLRRKASDTGEAESLEKLIRALEPVSIEKIARFRLLLQELEKTGWNGSASGPRLLLFTESRVTQARLCRALAAHFKLKFRQEDRPRWAILLTGSRICLFDAHTYTQGRYMQMNLDEAFARRATKIFEAISALISRKPWLRKRNPRNCCTKNCGRGV
ncbi:hypothetical protein QUF72_08395 [Desulfobacterales bacterium HSG2]|nr:hypothetical protein [Desulfobacterales bacterium HSG2]